MSELLSDNQDVVVLDDLSNGCLSNVPAAASFIEGSILDEDLLSKLFSRHKFAHIFHAAAFAAEGLSHYVKSHTYRVNVLGTANLINASINHGVKCFVFMSSAAVYGDTRGPATEDMVPKPNDSYGVAKYAIEEELRCSRAMFGLDYIVFRAHNVFGERQNIWDRYRNVVGIFMNEIMLGRPLTIFGDGSQSRCFTYVRDISRIIALSPRFAAAYGHVFNIGSDERTSVADLARMVAAKLNVPLAVRSLPDRQEVHSVILCHHKVQKFGSSWNRVGKNRPFRSPEMPPSGGSSAHGAVWEDK